MVVFDAPILMLYLDESLEPPKDQATGDPIPKARERVECLIQRLADDNQKVVVPTPALSEVLVYAGPAQAEWLEHLNSRSCFRIASFDSRAAIEAAIAIREAIAGGDKKGGNADANWQKCKVDRQIVAIAKVEGAETIYTQDKHVVNYAEQAGLKAYGVADLPEPPSDPQTSLSFDPPRDI
jgi:hypothetical protein